MYLERSTNHLPVIAFLTTALAFVGPFGIAVGEMPCKEGIEGIAPLRKAFVITHEDNSPDGDHSKDVVRLTALSAGTTEIEALPYLRRVDNPKAITLELRSLDARQAKHLAEHASVLKTLAAVEVSVDMDTPISDRQLCYLSKISNLRNLDISYTERVNVTDGGISCLSKLDELEALALNNTRITDAGLVYLRKLKNLEFLSLVSTDLKGEGLRHLQGLPLRSLFVASTKIDGEGLSHVSNLKQLERLVLTECPIQGSGLKYLTNLDNLRCLGLSKTLVDDNSVRYLLKLTHLREFTSQVQRSRPR